MSKKCNKCGEIKELSEYGKSGRRKDGLNSSCRECSAAYSREQYRKNPTKHEKRQAKYRESNAEKIKESNKRYREENRDKILLAGRKFRDENPEKIREWQKTARRSGNLVRESQSSKSTYLVTDGDFLKIGSYSEGSLDERVRNLQTGNPRKLKVLATSESNIEKLCHYEFEHLNVLNEWFKLDLELITFFTENAV